jgi:hypothetical protein
MKSMNFSNLRIGERFGKGCKTLCKVAVVGVLATSLVAPMTAHAYVEPTAIVSDHEYSGYTRTSVRSNDVKTIDNMFTNNVTIEKVSAAIELSDAVNSVICWNPYYANTSLNEVKNLQPTSLLRGLENARRYGNEWNYCNNLRDELAAIDAYTMFGCKTVSEELKEAIGNKVASIVRSYGMSVTKTKVVIECNEAYVLVSNSSSVVKVNLYGSYFDEVRYKVTTLEDKYERATADMKGTGWCSEPSFAYNGVNRRNGQSAWLSLSDDERKGLLREGIYTINEINCGENIDLDFSGYYAGYKLSSSEKQCLRNMGYTTRQVNNNKECSLTMDRVMVYQPHFNGCAPQHPNNCYVPNNGLRPCNGCEVDWRPHFHE